MLSIFVVWKKPIYQIQKAIIGDCYKNRARFSKTASQKLAHKASEATEKFMGNNIADKTVKPKTCA